MRRRRFGFLAVLLATALAVAACGGGGGSTGGQGGGQQTPGQGGGQQASGRTYKLIMGNTTSKDTQEQLAQKFLDLVKEKSGGRIVGELHTAGALGGNLEILRGLQSGAVQGAINPTAFLSTFVPEIGVLELPWLYPGKTLDESIRNTTKALQGEAGKKVRQLAEAKGFRIVSLFGLSPNMVFSKTPIRNLDEFKNKKIRVVPGAEHTGTFKDWGAVPTAMELGEVYTSIQQGVIEGVEDPPDVSLRMKFHEVAPYVAVTNHINFVEYVAVSKVWYDSLPDDLKKAVDEAGKQLEQIGTEAYAKSEVEALEALKKDPKVTVTEFSAEELAKMKQLNERGVWQEVKQNPGKAELLNLLQADIAKLVK